jgi:hypothetical protein
MVTTTITTGMKAATTTEEATNMVVVSPEGASTAEVDNEEYNNRGGRRGRGGRYEQAGRHVFIPRDVLEAVPQEFRGYMIQGRNQAQQEANENNKRNAPAADRANSNNEDGTVGATTIRSVQFEEENTNETQGNASSLFGATGRKKRHLGAVVSFLRRIGKAIQVGKPTDYLMMARAEIDTTVDMVCAGSTSILHGSTGKVVDVSGFHEHLDTIRNIQVGTCVTALDLNNETIIASFPQSLYFGNTMKTS